MSKKIKQDYEEQKRQAAEANSINQLETFHAESMTMEAHKRRFDSSRFKIFSFSYVFHSSFGQIFWKVDSFESFQMLGNDQIEIVQRFL